MTACEFCDLAAELAHEHGHAALVYARRAASECATAGDGGHAAFWHALSIFIDDIIHCRIDPDRTLLVN